MENDSILMRMTVFLMVRVIWYAGLMLCAILLLMHTIPEVYFWLFEPAFYEILSIPCFFPAIVLPFLHEYKMNQGRGCLQEIRRQSLLSMAEDFRHDSG